MDTDGTLCPVYNFSGHQYGTLHVSVSKVSLSHDQGLLIIMEWLIDLDHRKCLASFPDLPAHSASEVKRKAWYRKSHDMT